MARSGSARFVFRVGFRPVPELNSSVRCGSVGMWLESVYGRHCTFLYSCACCAPVIPQHSDDAPRLLLRAQSLGGQSGPRFPRGVVGARLPGVIGTVIRATTRGKAEGLERIPIGAARAALRSDRSGTVSSLSAQRGWCIEAFVSILAHLQSLRLFSGGGGV